MHSALVRSLTNLLNAQLNEFRLLLCSAENEVQRRSRFHQRIFFTFFFCFPIRSILPLSLRCDSGGALSRRSLVRSGEWSERVRYFLRLPCQWEAKVRDFVRMLALDKALNEKVFNRKISELQDTCRRGNVVAILSLTGVVQFNLARFFQSVAVSILSNGRCSVALRYPSCSWRTIAMGRS